MATKLKVTLVSSTIAALIGCGMDRTVACSVFNAQWGRVANDGQCNVAFISDCEASAKLVVVEADTDLVASDTVPGAVDGLISASGSLEVVVVQSGALGGGHQIGRDTGAVGADYDFRPLSLEQAGTVSMNVAQLGQDEAAVSPNGEWAIYTLNGPDPGDIRIARVRVQ